jgi:hypothetical protein
LPASCRQLQASGLCSPETEIAGIALFFFVRAKVLS